MSVNSKAVQGRRKLHFQSLDDMLADAEKLVSSPAVSTLGNWPLSQLLSHLATAMNASIDGIPFVAPWYFRLLGLVIKRRALKRGVGPGFRLPKEAEAAAFPQIGSPLEALDMFRKAVARLRHEKASSIHPVLGKLNHEEWTQLHLRHAEMHLSFAVPS